MGRTIAASKVAIYIRWSTEDQGQGHTLEIQRESCRYYCLSQGWAASDDLTFIDEGYSGSTLERPALGRLRSAVQSAKVDCVVVYKLDRLSRNVRDIINLVLGEWEDTCCVRSTQEPVDTTSDAGKMFFTLLGSFADFERSTIRTRTWSGKRKNAEKGRNPGMVYPFGFQKGGTGEFALVAEEAAVVQRIFETYLKGASCHAIACDLNETGLRTRSGRLWADAAIARLLRNPLYMGQLVYNRRGYAQSKRTGRVAAKDQADVVTCEGAAPAVIDAETWRQVQRVRADRSRVGRSVSPRGRTSPYLLSGLLRCGCGHAWVGIQGGSRGERFYACAGARAVGPLRCASRSIRASVLDEYVLTRVRESWPLKGPFSADLMDRAQSGLQRAAAFVRSLRQRLNRLEAGLERFKSDYKSGRLSAEAYTELSAECRTERAEALTQVLGAERECEAAAAARMDRPLAQAWHAHLDPWDVLWHSERQQVLRLLVSRIQVSRPKGSAELDLHLAWRLPVGATRNSSD